MRVVEPRSLALLTGILTASLASDHCFLFVVPVLVLVAEPSALVWRAWLVWPCLVPLVAVVLPLPQQETIPFDHGSRSGMAVLAVLVSSARPPCDGRRRWAG